ncbi:sideroflexin-2 isoform 3-T3 [Morphnus guianensis]
MAAALLRAGSPTPDRGPRRAGPPLVLPKALQQPGLLGSFPSSATGSWLCRSASVSHGRHHDKCIEGILAVPPTILAMGTGQASLTALGCFPIPFPLQDSARRGFLAVGEPVLQRHRQLHQPQCRLPHLTEANRGGLRHGHRYSPSHCGGTQPLHQGTPGWGRLGQLAASCPPVLTPACLPQRAPPLLARWVPFAAVAAANCVNIPMMRQQEIINGVMVTDRDNNELGHSRRAAAKGIAQVVVSRITMAAPGMIILPIIMERLEKFPFMQRIRVLHGPLQVLLCGGFLLFMVPAACALFPQKCSLALADLELELHDSIVAKHGDKVPYVYFNKGL